MSTYSINLDSKWKSFVSAHRSQRGRFSVCFPSRRSGLRKKDFVSKTLYTSYAALNKPLVWSRYFFFLLLPRLLLAPLPSSSPVPGIHNLSASDFWVQTPQMCATTPKGVWENDENASLSVFVFSANYLGDYTLHTCLELSHFTA